MQLNTQYQALPQMNEQSVKRDKTLDKIAAGLQLSMEDSASRTISSALQDQISTMTQGLMNITDGIAMMQIADSALSNLSQSAQSLNDLSVRYNNASLSEIDKQALQSQFQRTVTSMEQISATTTYNEESLFDRNLSFSTGSSTLSTMTSDVIPKGLDITNQDGIKAYIDTLRYTQSNLGSTSNSLQTAANNLFGQITQTSAAKSQIADTNMAKAISDFQSSNRLLDASVLASAHQTQYLQASIGRLLG
jgi:flagellin